MNTIDLEKDYKDIGNIIYLASAAAVVFGVYLSIQAASWLDPDTSRTIRPCV